jgi:YidC/Oxa1 family membrane protein insertase
MERGSITKWLFIGLAIILLMQFGLPGGLFGKKGAERQPLLADVTAPDEKTRPPAETCAIEGKDFRAELSTHGGSLRHVFLTAPKYAKTPGGKEPIDVVTTDKEARSPLRTDLRVPGDAPQQVAYDDVDWRLTAQDGKSCTFVHEDASTRITKTIAATGEPYQLAESIDVQNLAAEPRKHRLAVEQTSYRTKKEMEGSLGRVSEHVTESILATNEKTERLGPSDFEPSDFKDKEFTSEAWRRAPGAARWAAVASTYFTKIVVPVEGPQPAAEAQIQEIWSPGYSDADRTKDPAYGYIFRARLAYPETELKPQETAHYKVLSFTGPKDRDMLAMVGHDATDVINLGTFSPIAKVLVRYVRALHGIVGSWGWAIVLMTITVRMLLFPLSISQIKSSAAMRKLKPEMDEINVRYKDDAAQRGLALQELWRKHGVTNPVLGCVPALLQMPVWFALYQALQTAVETYHVPFGPFIPDLSAPGKYYIIPIVLGASSFFQQKLMPPQGDPAQQKMMQYMLPGIFLVMMLFLPAGLGVYMLTNTWLGIAQQIGVERYLRAKTAGGGGEIEVREKSPSKKTPGDDSKSAPALGKGKARVRG